MSGAARPPVLGVDHEAPAFTVPPRACDCHTHVFGEPAAYPYAADRTYTPGVAGVEALQALHRQLGIERVVVVQPSPYGSDNTCTLDALQRLGPGARGVAVIDEHTTDAQLQALHRAGVRGLRVNLETHGIDDPAAAARQLEATAARAAPFGWHLQVYTRLAVIAALEGTIRRLPTEVVVDHFGRASAALGPSQAHFDTLLSLLQLGKCWVKLSAPQRISERPDAEDAGAIARAFAQAAPGRLLWGSDWPHPGAHPGRPRRRDEVEPFHPIDDGHALNRLAAWLDDAALMQRVLVDNPARLYGFDD